MPRLLASSETQRLLDFPSPLLPKKIPNSAKQRRVCRISQPGTPLHRSTDLTIHATQFTETAIIDESKGRDKAEHNTQHHHHTRPRNRGTKKQSTESRTGRETNRRLRDSAAYRTTTRTPAISKPSTRSRRCFCGRRVMVWRRPLPRLYTRGRNAAERLCTRRIRQGNACRLRGVSLTRGPGAQLFAWQVRPPWVEWMDRVCPRATTSLPCGPGAHVFGCSPRNGGRGVRVASASRGRKES